MTSKELMQEIDDLVQTVNGAFDGLARIFRRAWTLLASVGACDDPGGAEYRRVWAAWMHAKCPRDVVSYIQCAANRPAPPAPSVGPEGEEPPW